VGTCECANVEPWTTRSARDVLTLERRSWECFLPDFVSLNEELTDGKRIKSLAITKEHDIRLLTAALEGLGPVTVADVS